MVMVGTIGLGAIPPLATICRFLKIMPFKPCQVELNIISFITKLHKVLPLGQWGWSPETCRMLNVSVYVSEVCINCLSTWQKRLTYPIILRVTLVVWVAWYHLQVIGTSSEWILSKSASLSFPQLLWYASICQTILKVMLRMSLNLVITKNTFLIALINQVMPCQIGLKFSGFKATMSPINSHPTTNHGGLVISIPEAWTI